MNLYVVTLIWFMVMGIPLSTFAAVPITINIDNQPVVNGTDCTVLSNPDGTGRSYGSLTIAGWQGSAARIGTGCGGTTDDDTLNDGLRFLTAVITSSDTNVEHTITFSGVYTNPPTASSATPVWYKLKGQGNFKRGGGAATGSTVKAWGYIQSPAETGTWTPITGSFLSKTIGLTSSFFNGIILSQPFPPPNIPGNRTLKSVFRFMFRNAGDSLQIDNSNGIVVYSSSSPGDGDEPGVHVPDLGKNCPEGITCLPFPRGQ